MKITLGKKSELLPNLTAMECVDASRYIRRMECGMAFARFQISPERKAVAPVLVQDVQAGLRTITGIAKELAQRKHSGRFDDRTDALVNPYTQVIKAGEKIARIAKALAESTVGKAESYTTLRKDNPKAKAERLSEEASRKLEAGLPKLRDAIAAADDLILNQCSFTDAPVKKKKKRSRP
jgi:hypothetical protein